MLPDIKRILYTTSLSDHTRSVLRHAIAMARAHGARVTILHVMEPLVRSSNFLTESYLSPEVRQTNDALVEQARETRSQQALDEIRARVARFYAEELGAGAHAELVEEIMVDCGSPPEMIVRRANILDADLIVVGRNVGGGGWKTVLRGSTARQVMQLTGRPVLAVSHGTEERWSERRGAAPSV